MSVASDILDSLMKTISSLNKKYGDNSVMDLAKVEAPAVELISTGLLSLDYELGGGLPKGRIIEIFGPQSSGKSTLSLHLLSKFYEKYPDKRIAFVDTENAFDPEYAEILGVDLEKLLLSQPPSAESALDIVEKLCQSDGVSCIVLDSVAQLVPMANLAKEIDGTVNIAQTARLLSQTLPRIVDAAAKTGTTVIFLNQIRMKIGELYGNPETTTGGMALPYAASIRIDVRGSKSEKKNGIDGHIVKFRIKKNKISKPGGATEIFLYYGQGFDSIGDLVSCAIKLKKIVQSGAWFEYDGQKFHGEAGIVAELLKNPELHKKLSTDIFNI